MEENLNCLDMLQHERSHNLRGNLVNNLDSAGKREYELSITKAVVFNCNYFVYVLSN